MCMNDERARTIEKLVSGRRSVTRFRPHGVMAVLGPLSFPMSEHAKQSHHASAARRQLRPLQA